MVSHGGKEKHTGISIGSWLRRSGCSLTRYFVVCRKLPLLSLVLVFSASLALMGWFLSLLNLACCVRIFVAFLSSRECKPVAFSISTIGVDFVPLVMILLAWFCTLLSLSECDFAAVHHEVLPYFMTGRT